MTVLALIPARKGSKRLPGKNLRELCGVPLLGWSVAQAREAGLAPLVASDDPEALSLATRMSARVLELPWQLTTDTSPMDRVVAHVMRESGASAIVLLQPTQPLRRVGDIKAIAHLVSNGAVGGALTVTDRDMKMHSCTDVGRVETGEVYACTRRGLEISGGDLRYRATKHPTHPPWVDIDTEHDWRVAEVLMAARLKGTLK